MEKLADIDNPLVLKTAEKLTAGLSNPQEKLAQIFRFVRDEIVFGFPPEGDFVKASKTIDRGYGQCNTKGILILALCKVAGIPARLHFSQISKQIQHGFFLGVFYWLMPKEVSHSWLEVKINDQWYQLDTYINDITLHNAAVNKLKHIRWEAGYSISTVGGEPSADFALGETQYSQMGAVVGDHGTWDEPTAYLYGPDYLNRPGVIKQWLYRLYRPIVNHRVKKLRESQHYKL